MEKVELNDFYNDGFGWICKHCEREFENQSKEPKPKRSRLMSEGEAENKRAEFSNKAMAKWTDKAQTRLICPRCGITESADKY